MQFISSNGDGPTQIIYTYISAFGGVSIAFAIFMVAIKMLLFANKKDTRERGMEALGKIACGGFIIGASLLLASFLGWIANTAGIELTTNNRDLSGVNSFTPSGTNDTFVIRVFAALIEVVPTFLIELIGKAANFLPLDELIFNKGQSLGLPPFTDAEWHNLNYMYICICTFVAPIMLIMIAKSGFSLVLYSDSIAKKIDIKEELSSWFICAVLLGTVPIFVLGLFLMFNSFTNALTTATGGVWATLSSSPAFDVSLVEKMQTGSLLTNAILHLLYAWQYVKINLVFISRKIVLAVMYAFTPIAVGLWGINHKVRAATIWFGEIISNASMQFFYAFTFTTMLVALGAATWQDWLLAIIWMTALIKVADMLKNSLQGFFANLSGVDEVGLANQAFGSVGATFGGMTAAFGQTLGGGRSKFKAADVKDKVFGETFGKKYAGNAALGNIPNMSSNSAPNVSSGIDVKKPNQSVGGGFKSTSSSNSTPSGNDTNGYVDHNGILVPSSVGNSGNSNVPNESNYDTDNKESMNETKDGFMKSLKGEGNEQNLYNSLLADNINKGKLQSSGLGGKVGNALKAMTMNDPAMAGFAQGIGNAVSGFESKHATTKAINKTVGQMIDLNKEKGISMTKQQALTKLFGDKNAQKYVQSDFKGFKILNDSVNDKLVNAVNSGVNRFREVGSNKRKFTSEISKGKYDKAAETLSQAHPYNKLNDDDKLHILAQSNSYTSMDGFSGSSWKM